jgi:dTDP-glucose 4,6-dehydratase
MKRVLLTGTGGSIGCHTLAHIMHNTDWEVVGLDSFRHMGQTDRVTEIMKGHLQEWKDRVHVFTHDLTAPISSVLSDRIGPIDYIINMASLSDVGDSIKNPVPFVFNNVQLAINMLEYARKTSPEVFIQISTDEVYGPSGGNEEHVEWDAIMPSNPYAASKAAQEVIAISYWRSYGVPLVLTNTMNAFGQMQQPNKYPAIVQRKVMRGETITIHGSAKAIGSRYYIHARNFADALVFILRHATPHLHGEGQIDRPDRYNLVGERRIDNLDLAQIIADMLELPLHYELQDFREARPGHDHHYGLAGTKLAKLGWKAPVSFHDSMKSTVEWSRKHTEWLEE